MHSLIAGWFHLVHAWGYLGVFVFMAIESSIFPLPSEMVMPPAAYYAAQGEMNFWLVVLAGTAGSLFGSWVMYGLSLLVGRPILYRYGKYIFLSQKSIEMAERFFLRYSNGGIFFGRLLPVVRHLQSIPAGLARMNLVMFSVLTALGAGLWCTVLAWFGQNVLGDNPHLLDSMDEMMKTVKGKMTWFWVAALVLFILYVVVRALARGPDTDPKASAQPDA